jgi:hypothetical protein
MHANGRNCRNAALAQLRSALEEVNVASDMIAIQRLGVEGHSVYAGRMPTLRLCANFHRRSASSYGRSGGQQVNSLIGQAVLEKRRVLLTDIPAKYVTIASGLVEAPPLQAHTLGTVRVGRCRSVIEVKA